MNRTYKRLLVMVLVCTMILGVLPAITLPIQAQEAKVPVYQAAYAESVTVDGALDKTFLVNRQMSEGAAFGAMWNRTTFYLAVQLREGDNTLVITFGDQKLTVTKAGATGIEGAKSAWGKVIEVSIPNTVVSYDDTKALSLVMGNAIWSGTVEYSSMARVVNVGTTPMRDWNVYADSYFQGGHELENGIRYTSIYGEAGDAITCYTLGYFDLLQTRKANISLEFDFYAEKMPVMRPLKPEDERFTEGFNITMSDGDINGFCSSIINTKNGLVYGILDKDNNYHYVEMGKSVKEKFQVRLEWTLEGSLNLFVDGALIKTFENIQADKATMKDRSSGAARMLFFGVRRTAVITGSDQDIDVTATNMCLGNSYVESPLAGLDFSVIAGMNNYASKVEYDLELPATYAHVSGQFPAEEIVWHSAREDYITTEGKVTPHATPLNVILTASLKRDPSVSTQILVKVARKTGKFLVVSSEETPMNLDGTMNEGSGAWKTEMVMSATEGTAAPVGTLYGAWGQGNVYLAVRYSNANSLELNMNNKVLRLDLASGTFMGESYGAAAKISGGVAELQIPLAGIGMYAYQYEQVMRFEAKLVGNDGTAAVYAYKMDISLTSEVKYEQNLNDYTQLGNPVISEDGTSATLTPAITPQAVFKNDLSCVDHSVDMTIAQTILATDIPVGTGGFASVTDVSQGYNFWVIDGKAGEEQSLLRAKIYNHAANGLVLQILKNNSMEIAEVVLGKTSGAEAEAFTLKLAWGKDNSVAVYVDNELKATIADVALTYEGDEMGQDGYQMHCAELGLKLTVSDFGMEIPPVSINFNNATWAGDVTISEDGTSATIKPVLQISSVGKNDLPEVDHTQDVVVTQNIKAGYLPVAAGGFDSLMDMDGGYHFLMVDGKTTDEQYVLHVKIFNDSERGLVLQALKNNELETGDVALGKAVGDTFDLKLQWKADNSLNVYVDDSLKGTVSGLTLTNTGEELGNNGFLAGGETAGMYVVITDLTFHLPLMSQDLANGNRVTQADVSADGLSATFCPPLAENGFWTKDLADVDHSQALTLIQTVLISEMIPAAGGFSSITDLTNGYHFWVADGEANAEQDVLRAKIYNHDTNGLVLQILKNMNLETAEVVLGKAVGESFLLELVWGTDGTVKVYVDGAEKATVAGVGLYYTGDALGSNSLRFCAMSAGMTVNVTNLAIASGASTFDFANNTTNYYVDVSTDGNTLTFDKAPAEHRVQVNGLDAVDHSKDMVISQTINAQTLAQSVPGFTGIKDAGSGYLFWVVDGAADTTQDVLMTRIYCDPTEGLVLQIMKNNDLETVDVILGKQVGNSFKLTLNWKADDSVVVSVDGQEKGTATDIHVTYTGGDIGHDGICLSAKTEGMTFTISNVTIGNDPAISLASGTKEGTVTVSGTSATLKPTFVRTFVAKYELVEVDHTKEMTLSQKIHVEAMPVGEKLATKSNVWYDLMPTGYYFWLVDGAKSNGNSTKYFTLANMYNDIQLGLVLQVQKGEHGDQYEDVVLGKQVGDTFVLDYKIATNKTVSVYVDGALKGTVANAGYLRYTDNGRGYDSLSIACDVKGAKITTSDVSIRSTCSAEMVGATATQQFIMKDGLAEMDHTQEMLFTQKLQVVSLPVSKKMVTKSDVWYDIKGTGYYFWLVDGEKGTNVKYFTFANLYNDAEHGLVLQIQKGEHGDQYEDVVLGKREGDTFTLGYKLFPNNTVEVFVDGALVGSVANAGYNRYTNYSRGYDGYTLSCALGGAKVIVSDVSISSTYITNSKTDNLHIYENGLAEVDRTANMLFSQTLKVNAMPVGEKMLPTPEVWYPITGTSYFFWLVDGVSSKDTENNRSDKYYTLANLYNDAEHGLVLQIQKGERGNEYAEVILGKQVGDTFTLGYQFKAINYTVDIYVDGVLMGTVVGAGYNRWSDDGRGYDGYFINSRTGGTDVEVSNITLTSSFVQRFTNSNKQGDVVVKNTTATFDMKATTNQLYLNDMPEMDHTKDVILSQEIRIDAMPVDQPMVSKGRHLVAGNGLSILMTDGAKGETKNTLFVNIYNSSKQGLVLQVEHSNGALTDVVLGKKLGETFTLVLKWAADHSTSVYVDGKLKGTYLNTSDIAAGETRGQDRVNYSVSGMGEVKVHISNVYLTPGVMFNSVQEELTPAKVFEGIVDITNVDTDVMRFPEYYDSPYLGRVPLTWKSSDSDVINVQSGKVYHKNAKIGLYVTLTATIKDIRDRELFKVEAYAAGTGVITIQSPKTLYASFADNVVLDGKFTAETNGEVTDEGWQMNTLLGEIGVLGVQWDTKNLYIAVRDLDVTTEDALSITLKGNPISLDSAVVGEGVTELAIPLGSLGIYVNNYGIEIPAAVQLGEGMWTGTIVLSSTNWIVSDTTNPRVPSGFDASGPIAMAEDLFTDNQYIRKLNNGYSFHDLYDVYGFNPHSINNYLYLCGVVSTQEPWEFTIMDPIEDKTVAVYAELDFQAMQMPEYRLGTSSPTHRVYATCGFNWNIALDVLYDRYVNMYSTGIINTSDGLYFVARGSTGDKFVRLDKYLGDYFRLGLRMEVDGGLTVYIDGEEVAYLKNIEQVQRALGSSMFMCTLRSDDRAMSSNDNFEVYVSNIAVGQNYGDTLLDTLIWNDIRGKNGKDMGAVTRDVKLPETWSTAQLPEPQKITWTSSDPSVLNAENGDVVRPEGNGKYVVLTATVGSESKDFELFVKGLNPDGEVMAVKDDRDTANGKGDPENEIHFYNLDQDNNSIIIDQGETKKVNVIQLIDNDATNRLNESVLTIWYSDDNKTYTEIDGYFKLLRDGVNTWLYDFEVEARYIKVHCTHYNGAESDMVNILRDMIKVDYVSVFGDGDAAFATTTAVAVKNDKDNTIFDQFFTITPEEAGVKCLKADKSDVRFFLGDELLYHYFDGTNFVVRVTKVPANDEAILTVLSGNAEAWNIDNKEYVYEVVYGTREGQDEDIVAIAIGMPNGEIMGLKGVNDGFSIWQSDNDGRTWKDKVEITNSKQFLDCIQAIHYDDHNGRLLAQGRHMPTSTINITHFMYSEDMGKTWKQCKPLDMQGKEEIVYATYAYFCEVSSYDGEGPNVDLVLPLMCGIPNVAQTEDFNWYIRVAYTTDAGLTWTLGTEEIFFTDTEGRRRFAQENGITESSIMEDDNGRLVLITRCQYGGVYNFAVSYSYDFGLTWQDAEGTRGSCLLSTVYAPNTDPKLFEINSDRFLFWGANTVLGADSYQRQPFNVAVSYDNMDTFVNIQDMFSRYSMQGMTMSTRCYVMNPDMAYDKVDDNLFLVWQDDIGAPSMRIYNFTDFFYRTRGAYDSFENSTVKYEGWEYTSGTITASADQATDGSYSMKMDNNSSVVRSVPYLQKGKISFDLYMENKDANELQFELEAAYGLIHGFAAPVAFTIRDGKLYFLAADRTQTEVEIAATLQNGWNHFEFDLGLAEEEPYATMAVNGAAAVDVPMALDLGTYITFVHVSTVKEAAYLDNFLVVDDDNFFVPEEQIKGEVGELTEVPEVLKEQYTDVKAIEDAMMNALVESNKDGYTALGSKTYSVDLLITRDNGKNWRAAVPGDLLMDGVVVKLDYPATTSRESHTFSAVLMGTVDSAKLDTKVGEAKILNVSAEADAIYVTMTGSGPVLLTWVQTGDAPVAPDGEGNNTWIFIVIGVLAALAAAVVVILVIRKKRASAPAIVASDAEEIAAQEAVAEENEVNNEEET